MWLNILLAVVNATVWKLLAGLRFGASCGSDTRLCIFSFFYFFRIPYKRLDVVDRIFVGAGRCCA